MKLATAAVLAAAMSGGAARAEVVETGPQGFRLRYAAEVAAPPAKVWTALGAVGRWWNGEHTYSGKAANLSLPLKADACFCEAVPPGGSVRHGVVALVLPQKMLRIEAALGPLQDEGVSGAWFFEIKPQGAGSELTMTYNVGGARDRIVGVAPVVDKVMADQFARLKRYVETGKPE